MFKCRSLGMSAKRRLNEGVVVPTALYGAETWNMGAAESKRLNVMEMRCLRSMCGVTRMDRVRNDDVRRRTGVVKKLAERAEQGVLRWSGFVEIIWLDRVKRALGARGMSVEQGRMLVRDKGEQL